jgi:hypothetical protein
VSLQTAIEELRKAHAEAKNKYTYFLLAAAGAAIGFAVQKTEGLPLSWWLVPVALATVAWAGSFYCGCRNLSWLGAAVAANHALLQLRQGSHPQQPPHPELVDAALRGTSGALAGNIGKAESYAAWQFWLLIVGAVFFIAWRVLEMWRVTT